MSVIRILPEAVANKISAGEVVERPASVVKELLENSLDAGASRIDICVEAGGKRLISVEDDGCGMARDDALLAFERHATSKIRSAEDLLEIATLGFRGEALPSIASVSRMILETRHASESGATRIEIAGGRMLSVSEVARAAGTRIEVRDLFFNTPARRKFLKSESTELGHIASLATHYALAHPEKSARLFSFTHEILNASPVSTFRERLYQVMGSQTLDQLVEIAPAERAITGFGAPEDRDEYETEPPRVRLFGFVSRPEVQRLNRNQIYFFVNGRLVRDRVILHATTEAYRNILPSGMFPVALVFLECPATEVDVNVHPSKTEVRFRHTQFIHDFARDTIRAALVASRPVAAFPLPPSRRAAAAASVLDTEAAEKLADEAPWAANQARAPLRSNASDAPWPGGFARARSNQGGFSLAAPQPEPETGALPFAAPPAADTPAEMIAMAWGGHRAVSHQGAPVAPRAAGEDRCAATAGVDATAESAPSSSAGDFPKDLRPLGQVQDSFIIAANREGLWIIDQHVAHERILFEQHLGQRGRNRVEAQRLLMPIVVQLVPEQRVVFQQLSDELAASGFEAEPFGQGTIAVKTAPAEIRAEDAERLLLEILDGPGAEAPSLSLDLLRHKIAASVACHGAIKVNMPLDSSKMQWLLRELEKTACPMTCPHGRPVLLRYSLRDIQKAFKRI
ncbi:MAG: DNA mismatch repair endonuclease MutL [Terriglobia bacterium]